MLKISSAQSGLALATLLIDGRNTQEKTKETCAKMKPLLAMSILIVYVRLLLNNNFKLGTLAARLISSQAFEALPRKQWQYDIFVLREYT